MTQATLSQESVLDLSAAIDNLGGDVELLQEIVEMFVDVTADQLQSIGECIGARNVEQVAILAHGMKGSASNFCARDFVKIARDLEMLACSGRLEGAEELLASLNEAFDELREVIRAVCWEEVVREHLVPC